METDRHTDTQTHKPSTVTLAAHARRGLMIFKIIPFASMYTLLSLYTFPANFYKAKGVISSALF